MRTRRRIVLLLVGSMVLPAGLSGCRRSLTVAGVDRPALARAAEPETEAPRAAEGFRSPDDRGGALLARALPPAQAGSAPDGKRPAPKRRAEPPAVESSPVFLPPAVVLMPPANVAPKRPPLRPQLVHEETLGSGPTPVLPQALTLAAGERVRQPSTDINQPPALPLLTVQPLADQASLEDATGEASTGAALAATLPQRAQTVPFQRLAIPDPYENRQPAPADAAGPEGNHPPATPPQTPPQR